MISVSTEFEEFIKLNRGGVYRKGVKFIYKYTNVILVVV